MMRGRIFMAGAAATLALAVSLGAMPDSGHAASDGGSITTLGAPSAMRRLSEHQYKHAIADIFGADVTVPGRFEPRLRQDGLLATGDSAVSVSSSGFEQYALRSREVAAQVLAEDRRERYFACDLSGDRFDEGCANAFFTEYGRRLYRRPLGDDEMASVLGLVKSATGTSGSFAKGMTMGLERLLVSPNFVFRIERTTGSGGRLDAWSFASRLSFLLWDAPPDDALLDAAASGELDSEAGVIAQVDRMIASDRFPVGTRAFLSDMFAYDQFDGLTKDQKIYPKYSSQLAEDAREQALRTIVDLLVTRDGDYRDLFTTRRTFMNRNLGALYRVPVSAGAIDGWVPHEFDEASRRKGMLSLAAFLMLDPTHEGRSSPTMRGKNVREAFLCQPVPPPPPNVNFSIVQDTGDPDFKTARQRLRAHSEDPSCAGCHRITDPIGLSMENYDAVGAWRTHENGALIDVTGEFEGQAYDGLMDLAARFRESPAVPACAVQRVVEYATGRATGDGDAATLDALGEGFAADGYSFPALMRRVALSPLLRSVGRGQMAHNTYRSR